MMRHINRARRSDRPRLAVVAGSLLLGACDVKEELLAPQQPGVIAAECRGERHGRRRAVRRRARAGGRTSMNGDGGNTEAIWNWEALFTDEVRSADTFSQRNDADQRNLQTNDGVLHADLPDGAAGPRAGARRDQRAAAVRHIAPPASSTSARCT